MDSIRARVMRSFDSSVRNCMASNSLKLSLKEVDSGM